MSKFSLNLIRFFNCVNEILYQLFSKAVLSLLLRLAFSTFEKLDTRFSNERMLIVRFFKKRIFGILSKRAILSRPFFRPGFGSCKSTFKVELRPRLWGVCSQKNFWM